MKDYMFCDMIDYMGLRIWLQDITQLLLLLHLVYMFSYIVYYMYYYMAFYRILHAKLHDLTAITC